VLRVGGGKVGGGGRQAREEVRGCQGKKREKQGCGVRKGEKRDEAGGGAKGMKAGRGRELAGGKQDWLVGGCGLGGERGVGSRGWGGGGRAEREEGEGAGAEGKG